MLQTHAHAISCRKKRHGVAPPRRHTSRTSVRELDSLAVAAVLGPARDGACALCADLFRELGGRGAGVYVAWLRRLCHVAAGVGVGAFLDEGALASVPLGEQLGRGRAAQDARVDKAGEADAGDVPRGAEDAFKIPDGLCAVRRKGG